MQIAIASGKGGTGKTTVATSLAFVAARTGRSVAYLDCDVEEPNGSIFLRPAVDCVRPIERLIPLVDSDRCIHCGECAQFCCFGAIASLPQKTVFFPELCHSCGGCKLTCLTDAIHEKPRRIGTLREGNSKPIRWVEGVLNVGETMSPPAIRAVKAAAPPADLVILDAPPGTSCPVVETIRGSDFVLLVTEPTPFGLHDLTLAVEMVRSMRLPHGIVVNRAGVGNGEVRSFCERNGLSVFAEIPDSREVAETYARGQTIVESVPAFAKCIDELLARLNRELAA